MGPVPLGGRVPVPATGAISLAPGVYGVCAVCHGPAAAGHRVCWSCHVVGAQLGGQPAPVVPVFLFALGSPVHRALVGYKAGVTPAGRAARTQSLATVLAEFLAAHSACLLSCSPRPRPALVVPVPSSIGGRPSWHGRHPVASLCEQALDLSPEAAPDLEIAEILRAGARPPARLDARVGGYDVDRLVDVRGRSAVVLDDVLTSGSRALSAAAALSAAGVRVTAVVALGRLVRPDHNVATARFWSDQSAEPFDPSRCTRCATDPVSRPVVAWRRQQVTISERLVA